MTSYKVPRYQMSASHGDLAKGTFVFQSLYHRAQLDGHRMVVRLPCGQGAPYSVPEGLLIDKPYDELDED